MSWCDAFLAANTVAVGETGTWTGSGGGVTVVSPNSPTSAINITGGSSGPVTLRWTITNPNGCSSYDDVIITNRGGLAVSAGSNQNLGHCYSTTQSTSLGGSYAGSGIDGQQGTWSIVSGPNVPVISSIHSNTSGVSNLITGTYVFRWTVVGPCTSGTSTVQVTVEAPTANITGASVLGGNQVFCDATTTSTVLSGSTPTYINETVTWAQTGGPGGVTIVNPNSPVTSITGMTSPNTYTFSYTINNPVTVCSTAASVSVSYLPNSPTLTITTTDPILLNCGINSATINFNAGGSGVTQYRLISGPDSGYPTPWTDNTSSGSGAGLSQVISGLTSPGTYVVQMQRFSTLGAASACGAVYGQISIVTSLSTQAANAGTDQILNCNVTGTDLVGNVPAVGQGTWSQVSGPSAIILTSPHSPTLTIGGLLPDGLYVFRWVISGGPICTPTQDDVQVFTAATSPLAHNPGVNQTNVCYNSPVHMQAEAATFVFEIGTWTVSPTDNVAFSDIHSPTATVTNLLAS